MIKYGHVVPSCSPTTRVKCQLQRNNIWAQTTKIMKHQLLQQKADTIKRKENEPDAVIVVLTK